MIRSASEKGMSLISMLIAIALSAFLALGLSQTLQGISKSQQYTASLNQLNYNAQFALTYLQQQLSQSGYGMGVPAAVNPLPAAGAPQNALSGWVPIGCFADVPSYLFSSVSFGSTATPLPSDCASAAASNVNFFAMMNGRGCYAPATLSPPLSRSALLPIQSAPSNCASACSANGAYNCGGTAGSTHYISVYERVVPHSLATLNSGAVVNGQTSDSISMHISNPSGTERLEDCFGNAMTGHLLQTFQVNSSQQIQCKQIGPSSTPIVLPTTPSYSNSAPILNGVEYMKILLGESDYGDGAVSRYLSAGQVIDSANIVSARIALVMVTADVLNPVSALPPAPIPLMQGPNGVMLTFTPPNDGRVRKVFVTTVYFKNRAALPYENHCVSNGGSFYIRSGGVRHQNTWQANDSCCTLNGTSCLTYGSLASCESAKTAVACTAYLHP